VVGDRVFVTVQRVDRQTNWGPVGESFVAVIDMATDGLVDADLASAGMQPLLLSGTNPFSDMVRDPGTGNVCVASVGEWGLSDGGIEMINPSTLQSEGFVFTEAAAQGDITDFVLVSADRGYAIVTDANFHNVLVSFNPQTGVATGTVYAPGDFVLQDIELAPTGALFLSDRTTTKPGIRMYDGVTGVELTTDPIDVGLPPFDITFGAVK